MDSQEEDTEPQDNQEEGSLEDLEAAGKCRVARMLAHTRPSEELAGRCETSAVLEGLPLAGARTCRLFCPFQPCVVSANNAVK